MAKNSKRQIPLATEGCTKEAQSEFIATWLATIAGYDCGFRENEQARPCGLMDKAPDFGSGDCRFESCHGRYLFCLNDSFTLTLSDRIIQTIIFNFK